MIEQKRLLDGMSRYVYVIPRFLGKFSRDSLHLPCQKLAVRAIKRLTTQEVWFTSWITYGVSEDSYRSVTFTCHNVSVSLLLIVAELLLCMVMLFSITQSFHFGFQPPNPLKLWLPDPSFPERTLRFKRLLRVPHRSKTVRFSHAYFWMAAWPSHSLKKAVYIQPWHIILHTPDCFLPSGGSLFKKTAFSACQISNDFRGTKTICLQPDADSFPFSSAFAVKGLPFSPGGWLNGGTEYHGREVIWIWQMPKHAENDGHMHTTKSTRKDQIRVGQKHDVWGTL